MDIVKTTKIQRNGMAMIPKELREWLGNPERIMWIDVRRDRTDKQLAYIRIKIENDSRRSRNM